MRKNIQMDIQERYQSIFQSLPTPALLLKPTQLGFIVLDINQAYISFLGIETEVKGKNIFELFLVDLNTHFQSNLQNSLNEVISTKASHKITKQKFSITSANSYTHDLRYCEIENTPVLGEQQQVDYIIHTIKDITSEVKSSKKSETLKEKRRKAEKLLKETENVAGVGGWEYDVLADKMSLTQVTREIFQLDSNFKPTFENTFILIKEGEDRELVISLINKALESGAAFDVEVKAITKLNGERWLRATGRTELQKGKCIRLYGAIQDIHERKQAEELIKVNERRYRAMVENGADAIIIFKPDGTASYVSPSITRVLGYREDEVIDRPMFHFFHPDDIEEAIQVWQNALSRPGELMEGTPFRFLHKDGTWRWLEGSLVNMLHDPVIAGIVDNFRDVTEKKQAADVLANREAELVAAQRMAKFGNWSFDFATKRIKWSDELYNVFGTNKEAFKEDYDSFEDFIDKDYKDLVRSVSQKARIDGEPFDIEYRITTPAGDQRIIKELGRSERDKNGKLVRLFGTSQDITDLRKAEAALERSFKEVSNFKYALDAGSMVIMSNTDGKITYANQKFADFTGYTEKELIGNFQKDFIADHADITFLELANKTIKTGKVFRSEIKNAKKNGDKYWADITIVPFMDHNNTPIQYVTMLFDITDKKNSEIALQERNHFIEMAIDNLPIGICVNRIDNGSATLINKKYSEIYGWPAEDLEDIDSFYRNVFPDKDYCKIIRQKVDAGFLSGDINQMAWDGIVITTKQGEQRIVNAKNIPLYEQNLMISTVMDETDRTRANEALIEKGKLLAANAEVISILLQYDDWDAALNTCFEIAGKVISVDRVYYFENYIDEATGKMLSKQTHEWVSEGTHPEIDNPEMLIFSLDNHDDIMSTFLLRKPFTAITSKLPVGNTRDLFESQDILANLALPIYIQDNFFGFMGFDDCNKEHEWSSDEVFFLRSLTSNVAAAIEKRESEKRYRDLFHLSPQPMWVFEVDSLKFLDVNESAIAHYGYTREEFLSMTMLDIRPLVEAAHAGNVLSQLENGNQESERKIYKHKKKDGTLIQVDIKSNNIYFKGKSAKVVLANDVTERINYISAIENQNTILQEIAWIQSHVVRAPLARLMALVNLKDTIDQAGLSQEELFKLIMNSANELDTIIRDIVGRSEHIEFTIQA